VGRLRRGFSSIYHTIVGDRRNTLADISSRLKAIEARVSRHDPAVAYIGNCEAVVTTVWGSRLIVRTDDYIVSPELLSAGTYEIGLTTLLPRLLAAGDTVVDVGANIGYYSVLAGKAVGPTGHVVALEPHPGNARLLQTNLVLNGFWGNSTVGVCAAFSGPAELEFFARGRFGANSSLAPVTQEELDELGDTQDVLKVRAVDLDSYLAQVGHAHDVRLIKVDVEGAELFAFQGAERLLRETKPRIVVEWSPGQQTRAGYSPATFIDHLEQFDLQAAIIDPQTGDPTPLPIASLLEIDYANVLLVPSGSPLLPNH